MKIQVSIRRSAFALGILTAAAVFYLGAHVLELSPFAQRAWMDALWTAAGAFATWQSYLTLRHVSPRYRKGWVACTLAAAAWTLGMLSWSWQELVAGEISPFPSAADFGFLAYPIVIVAGFLMLPTRHQPLSAALWKGATLLVFVSSVCFVSTIMFFSDLIAATGSGLWFAHAYPFAHSVAFLYAVFITASRIGSQDIGPNILMSLALLCLLLVNSGYALLLNAQGPDEFGLFNNLWLIGFGFHAWAAAERRALPPEGPAGGKPARPEIALSLEAILPALCGAVAISVLYAVGGDLRMEARPYLALFAFIFIFGASVQQFILLRSEYRRAAASNAANVALRESETRFRDIAELTADWFWETDLDQRFKYISSIEAFDSAQTPPESWIGRTRWDVVPDLTGTSIAESIQTYMDRGADFHDLRHRFIHAERGETWIAVSGKPFYDEKGTMVGYRGIGRDITAHVLAKRKAKEQEILLRLVIDNVPTTVYLKDLEGRYLLVNRKQEEFLNLSKEELEGRKIAEILGPERAAEYEAQDRAVIESRSAQQFETKIAVDGVDHYLHITKFPVFDADGEFIAIGGINVDVTKRLELEQQLNQAQKLEAIGRLTGGVAHDFNNLLAVILGNAELLSEGLADRPRLKELSDTIEIASERGAELTQRLLAYSRQQGLEPSYFDANTLIEDFRTLLERSLGARVEIETDFATSVWQTYADTGQLENALLNLAINARDAMPEGGKLVIETENVVLDDSYHAKDEDFRPGPYVAISVADTGEGMSEAVQEQAFDPFFTTKEVGQGSGLGLSMVYGYLKQSGGFARIYSEEGLGTRVTLYLPAYPGCTPEPRPAPEAMEAPRGSERILVVEDSEMVRDNVVSQLAGLGYRTLQATDGNSALELLRGSEPIDLLFSDMIMPGGLHGYDLVREALRLRPEMKVVMTTGFSDISHLDVAQELQQLPILYKPFHRVDLARTLRRVLDGRRPTA